MAITALLALAIGANIFGRLQQREGIAAEGEASEAALKFNAAQTRREAQRLRKVGAEGEFQLRRDLRRRLARNRVRTAAAGVDPSDGTALDTELLAIRDAAEDIATLEENIRLQSQELELTADFQVEQARDVRRATSIRQRSNILGGIGDVLGKLF